MFRTISRVFIVTVLLVGSAASAAIIRVDPHSSTDGVGNLTNWSNAHHDLQDALDEADSGDEIWVAANVYTPTLRTDVNEARSVTFNIPPSVRLYGGFEGYSGAVETVRSQRNPDDNETVLSGELGDPYDIDDNAMHVVTFIGTSVTDETQLNGFTVRDGNAALSMVGQGGGISIRFGAYPVIARCKIIQNENSGIYVYNRSGSDPEVEPAGPAQFLACTFTQNHTTYHGGAAFVNAGKCNFINCLVFDNVSDNQGGFLDFAGSEGAVINCTIVNNYTDGADTASHSAIVKTNFPELTIVNSILRGNANSDGSNEYAQVITDVDPLPIIYNCDIEGLDVYAGNGNIDVDPLFVDEGSDNYRLEYASYLLNSGAVEIDSNNVIPTDAYDIDDDSSTTEPLPDRNMDYRQVNSSDCLDIGAFENQVEGSCFGDVTDDSEGGPDGVVDDYDLDFVSDAWATPGGVADLTPGDCGNNYVNMDDLLTVLNNWGSCSPSLMESNGWQGTLGELITMLLEDISENPQREEPLTALIDYLLENGL